MVINTATSVQQTRDEIGSEPTIQPIFKVKNETIIVEEGPSKSISRAINNSFIVGHPTNGIIGTTTGDGGGQVVIGDTDNTTAVIKVVNPSNTFVDRFNYDTFIDYDNTTATPDVSTNFRIDFTSGQIAQSTEAFKNEIEVYNVTVDWTSTGTLTIEISTDNGVTWTEVTKNTKTTLPSSLGDEFPMTFPFTFGGDEILKWRATESGASTATLECIKIAYNK